MTTSDAPLYMVQLWLAPRRMVQLGQMLRLPLRTTDTNYLVHCALGELFGSAAPKPFFVDDDPRTVAEVGERPNQRLRVVGYADVPASNLRGEAKLCPNPTITDMCDWEQFAGHSMPASLPEGRRLRFELRAVPVVRKASSGSVDLPDGSHRSWTEGEELDAFLSEAWKQPDTTLDRESVYTNWLRRQLDIRGGAKLESVGVSRFSIERVVRRTYGEPRTAVTVKIPDVTFEGFLEVTDPPAFHELLRSGIGRHKSFGYGMLKIRRA